MPKSTGRSPVRDAGDSEPRGLFRLFAALVAALVSSHAPASWNDVLPRPFENGVYLDVFGSYETDKHEYGTRSYDWNDLFLREKITLFSDGYVYHPRFLHYFFSLGGGLKQERYEASGIPPVGWTNDSSVEYEARLFFLPEHHYNLQLFSRRWEPLLREQSATQRNSVQTSNGAYYRYRKKPYFFNASFKDDTITSNTSKTDVTNFAVGGEYLKRSLSGNEFSLAAGYNPSRFSNSLGLEGTTTESVLTSVADVRKVRLRTSLSKNDFEQETNGTNHIESERFTWVEQLTAYLPANFRTDVLYRYQDGSNRYPERGSQAAVEFSELDKQLQVNVFQRLYESLDTTYTFLHGDRSSDSGETITIGNSLAVNYSKLIPQGRFLTGLSFSRFDTDNAGRAEILNESHAGIAVPGSFILGQQNIDAATIAIFLRSPLPPFEAIQLVEGVHYTVTPIDVRSEIQIVALPPQFVVPGTYDFFASYSLATGVYELRSDTIGYHARVQLFEKYLIPYYSFVTTQSDVLSGTFPGDPLDSTTRTAGVASEHGALQGRIEHQSLDWDISPYESWRLELRSVGAFGPTMNGNATTSYLNRHFKEGNSPQSPDPYREQIMSASANLQKRFPSQGMTVSAGGSFSVTDSIVNTTAYSLNGTLVWKIGKLDLTAGAVLFYNDTSGGGFVPTSRAHQYYYATLRRRLF